MKTKFATYDLCAIIHDLNKLKGMRVANVYDINSKTYLLKLQRPDEKAFILFESGIRIHVTTYDWPKGIIPSGFSMKFRKHIRSKRLTAVSQVGVDRIIDLQFGDAERSAHVIVELYDRGNVILTDHEYAILNILRPRTDHDKDVRFSVRERYTIRIGYPLEQARQAGDFLPTEENILLFLQNANTGDALKKSLIRHIPFGSLLLDHVFTQMNIPLKAEIGVHIPQNEAGAELVYRALCEAKRVSDEIIEKPNGGFILYEEIPSKGEANGQTTILQTFKEYYPYDFIQFRKDGAKILQFETFSQAVDKYYSSIEAQKVNVRIASAEKEGEKKLQNIKKDHEKRLQALAEVKEIQERRGEYVLYNKELVEQAILMTRTALANLKNMNKELATKRRAPKAPPKLELGKWLETLAGMGEQAAANSIVKLKLDTNRFTMRLSNPYEETEQPLNVDIDMGLNADQNARKLFEEKRAAETKKEKTAASSKKALKSALKSAKQQAENKLQQAKSQHRNVIRARKTFWFEKFLWFISSDGYLVLGGKDAQQNELLVKRYMRPGDIYVHAGIQGASSIVIRNQQSVENIPPPRTLNEAGTFAVCFSTAWDANVSITAWWVRHDQVSRTAPAGEYLVSGSFMIRGKRNFLPSCPLHLGFGLMFKMDEESVQRHRKNDDQQSTAVEEEETMDEELESNDESNLDDEEEERGEEEEEDEFPDIKVRVGIDDSTSEANTKDSAEKEMKENDNGEEEEEEEDGDEEEEEEQTNEEMSIIESITANPEAEDELLFALPVVAPYSAMQRFKFKVKVTPGTCKRGKAVKMALDLFSRDKNLSIVEKTLIKSQIGDDRGLQLMPGKVRVSAPMLMNNKYK